ncbi:MAG TPA: DsbA family oxidoreductase [Actinomycetota bacterium]|nr:DsbA family oxidoreductase [Actinomycetota bacterium]
MKVEIWSDVVCPWCYIGKVRFELALASFPQRDRVEVVHRAFELDPTIPRGETRDVVAELAAKKGLAEEQVRRLMASVERVAAEDGLEYHLAAAPAGNTVDAHRLVCLAADRGRASEMVDRLYRAHFTELRSIFDVDSLVALAAEAGLDEDEARETLAGEAYTERVRGDEAVARSLGISGVPFFVIDGTYGISGAQPVEAFAAALEQAWAASQPLEVVAGDGAVCEDGVCY